MDLSQLESYNAETDDIVKKISMIPPLELQNFQLQCKAKDDITMSYSLSDSIESE